MHPHILIYLIGHDLLARLRGVLHGSVHAEVISELDRWSQAVLRAAISFRCDSQLGLSQRLGEDEAPLPLSAQQRSMSGQQYADVALVGTEQDGHYTLPEHEHLTGPLPLTGSYGTQRPLYLRRCGLKVCFFSLAATFCLSNVVLQLGVFPTKVITIILTEVWAKRTFFVGCISLS